MDDPDKPSDEPPKRRCLDEEPDVVKQQEAAVIIRMWYMFEGRDPSNFPREFAAVDEIVSNIAKLLSGDEEFPGPMLTDALNTFETRVLFMYPLHSLAMFENNHIIEEAKETGAEYNITLGRWKTAVDVIRILIGTPNRVNIDPCHIAIAYFMKMYLYGGSFHQYPPPGGRDGDWGVRFFTGFVDNVLEKAERHTFKQRESVLSFLTDTKGYSKESSMALLEEVRTLATPHSELETLVNTAGRVLVFQLKSLMDEAYGSIFSIDSMSHYETNFITPWMHKHGDYTGSRRLWNRALQIVSLAIGWLPNRYIAMNIPPDTKREIIDLEETNPDLAALNEIIALSMLHPPRGMIEPAAVTYVLLILSSDDYDVNLPAMWRDFYTDFIMRLFEIVKSSRPQSEEMELGSQIHMFDYQTLQSSWENNKMEFPLLNPESMMAAISLWRREKPKWMTALVNNLDHLSKVVLPSDPAQRIEARSFFLSMGIFTDARNRVIEPEREVIHYLKLALKETAAKPSGVLVQHKNFGRCRICEDDQEFWMTHQ